MKDPRTITNTDEYEAWQRANMQRLADNQAARLAEWEYLNSDEYKKSVTARIIASSHEAITPPWED